MRMLLTVILAGLFAGRAQAAPAAPERPVVRHAVVADCVLWTVDVHGKLAGRTVCDDKAGPATVPDQPRTGHAVLGVAEDNGDLWFAAAWFAHVSTPVRIRNLRGQDLPEFELKLPEHLIGFSVHSGNALVLTNEQVMTFAPGDAGWTRRPLAHPLIGRGEYFLASPLSDSSDLYVGRDAGEFGHDLVRIDARTGAVAAVTTDIVRCGWNQRYDCKPGGRVIADPFNRGCVIASATTDLLRLCAGRPARLIALPRTPAGESRVITNGDEIQGLAAGDGAVFASTFNGFYRINGDSATATHELQGVMEVMRDPRVQPWPPMLVTLRF